MPKTHVKFQKDRFKTVGIDAHTRYLLLEGWRGVRNLGNPNTLSPNFSWKMRGELADNIKTFLK